MQNNSRRQQQHAETRELLLHSAQSVFAANGYGESSIDEIAFEAGMTKGAVYHHFSNKQKLFEACYERQVQAMAEAIRSVPAYREHPWQSVMNRCRAFLDFGRRRAGASITLQEAISVLGWERWRTLDQAYSMGIVQDSVDALISAGLIETEKPELLADMIYHLLVGTAMSIAASAEPRQTREQAMATLAAMLRGLRPAVGRATDSPPAGHTGARDPGSA